ncbi:hypothetical protein ID854_15390 [Xenorhabdus sp. M]|uniref:Phage protein n=1 Tax=Xenorhabdus szentirmaii TaxID=290112 RepID=A0AAW3YUD9_9GAMM|nr:hypothetical protein [Xenorhabdus sp. M]MBD2801785.1 hypothetical protein [Xenorhabdus sp. M]
MSKRKKTYYTLDELKGLTEARGYLLHFNPYFKVFELKDKKHPENWCWVIRPSNEVKVGQIRECPMQEWDDMIDFNIARLKKDAASINQ